MRVVGWPSWPLVHEQEPGRQFTLICLCTERMRLTDGVSRVREEGRRTYREAGSIINTFPLVVPAYMREPHGEKMPLHRVSLYINVRLEVCRCMTGRSLAGRKVLPSRCRVGYNILAAPS